MRSNRFLLPPLTVSMGGFFCLEIALKKGKANEELQINL